MDQTEPQLPTPGLSPAPQPASSSRGPMLVGLVALIVLVIGVLLIANHKYNKPSTTSNAPSRSSAAQGPASPAKIAPALVSITKTGFVPATITVQRGQAVTWTNNDTAQHQPISDTAQATGSDPYISANKALNTNDTYTYFFNKAGSYSYHDKTNPVLQGVVIVK